MKNMKGVSDQRILCRVLRGLLEFYDGVAPLPTELAEYWNGENGRSVPISLNMALLEVIGDYEKAHIPSISRSIREASHDLVQ